MDTPADREISEGRRATVLFPRSWPVRTIAALAGILSGVFPACYCAGPPPLSARFASAILGFYFSWLLIVAICRGYDVINGFIRRQ
jgi:hypothetical protein